MIAWRLSASEADIVHRCLTDKAEHWADAGRLAHPDVKAEFESLAHAALQLAVDLKRLTDKDRAQSPTGGLNP